VSHDFDVDEFLARPLVARVATGSPLTVRPVWYLWEEGALWWLTGTWSRMSRLLAEDPRVALVIDSCELDTLEFRQVLAWGRAEVAPFDEGRARRKLRRYLGEDEATWPSEFVDSFAVSQFVRLAPERLTTRDYSKTRPAVSR
jgi:nitroimidazol reductase NimA-like FMN-containing flavoprotein (pyridoxamine 5'-phosphate oxidase superfamily)